MPQATPLPTIAEFVRERRETKRWSQSQLAAAAGVTLWTINRLENGHHVPSNLTVVALADALEVDRAELKQLQEAS